MTHESRAITFVPELRAAGAGQLATVAGYAAVFNSVADIGGEWREVIAPGAFAESIARDDVLAFAAHDSARILGRKSSGTLRLREDARGLFVEIDLPDTTDGRDVRELVARGDLKGMSIGFIVRKEQWDVDPPMRTIQSVELIEVSAVARPAYADTTLGMRSLEKAREEVKRQAEHNARQAAARIAERKALQEQKIRGLRPVNPR